MRYVMLLLVLTVASILVDGDPSATLDANDPGLRREGLLLLDEGEPLSGNLVERDEQGRVLALTPYRNGTKHGVARTWHANGTLASSRSFEHGVKVGHHFAWWENGRPRLDLHFADGVYQGTCREWYETGQIAHEARFESGHEVGLQRSWTMTGDLFSNYVVRDGRRYGLLGAKPCCTIEDDEATGSSPGAAS